MIKKDFRVIHGPSNTEELMVGEFEFETVVTAVKTVWTDVQILKQIISSGMFNSAIYQQTEQTLKSVISIVDQMDKGIINLNNIELMATSVTDLSESIARAKALNPLIANELVTTANKAATDANTAQRLIRLSWK